VREREWRGKFKDILRRARRFAAFVDQMPGLLAIAERDIAGDNREGIYNKVITKRG